METENTSEKLTISPEKIIPILLKHLMLLKNENAYIKKWARIKTGGNPAPETEMDTTNVQNPIAESDIGITNVGSLIVENDIGTTNVQDPIAENDKGTRNITGSISDSNKGTINVKSLIAENDKGTPNVGRSISDSDIGTTNIGALISGIEPGVDNNILLYSLFEKGLLQALDEYIKSADGDYTLDRFYSDFVKAIDDKNTALEKATETKTELKLEDTHTLPEIIPADNGSSSFIKLRIVLKGHLPLRTKRDMYVHLSRELILLHNKGKATSSELRNFAGMGKASYGKHLANLQKLNFIKKTPPHKYELTDYSKHFLLKAFGVPKTGNIAL